jgi:hypothetical protein
MNKYSLIIVSSMLGLVVGLQLCHVFIDQEDHHKENEDERAMIDDHEDENVKHAHSHGHGDTDPVDLTGDASIPEVALEVLRDETSGYNLKITTQNFTLAPENVNTTYVPNQGHAHIYVNGDKISRIYGEWFHLDGKFLESGENIITVSLNTNDHREIHLNGESIEASATVFE